MLAFVYLFVPIAYTIVFSFNDAGKTNLVWQGFTLDNWQNPCGAPDVCDALAEQPEDRAARDAHRDVLGTMVAFALARHRFRGRARRTC